MNIFQNKTLYQIIISAIVLFFASAFNNGPDRIPVQVQLVGNNISTWIFDSGIFNQDMRTSNTPGLQWPAGSNKFATFSTGLSIGAYVNGQIREAMASWKGELAPGYVTDSAGVPVGRTDSRFKFYSVKRTDSWLTNPDWLNWGLMVPFGAPYVDVNHSGYYEPMIDTPGYSGAGHTLFICLTDGFTGEHKASEGFGGGTLPLYAEVHLTVWSYNFPCLQDAEFLKWEIINKNTSAWNGAYFAIVCDPDLGFCCDDYIGCDTTRNLGYCYNGDNDDYGSSHSYGPNPPAVGYDLLMSPVNKYTNPPKIYNMTSFSHFTCISCGPPPCESDPNEPEAAYQFLRGYKKDGSPWVVPNTNPPQATKYCYSGDPETNEGWTESKGSVRNCGGIFGTTINTNPPDDRRLIISSGADNLTVNPGDKQYVVIAQFVARGSNNLNSVTLLKQLDDCIQEYFDSNLVIGVHQLSNNAPLEFILYQNYPNPFNPVTNIKFEIPLLRGVPVGRSVQVKLTLYDILGKEVEVLINKELRPGTYKINWDASNFPSGVYFYNLKSGSYSISKKMILLK